MLSMRISLITAVSHYLFPLPIPFYLSSFLLNFEGLRKIAHVPRYLQRCSLHVIGILCDVLPVLTCSAHKAYGADKALFPAENRRPEAGPPEEMLAAVQRITPASC